MYRLLLLSVLFLTACSDKDARDLEHFAHSQGVKELAKLGEKLLKQPNAKGQANQDDGESTSSPADDNTAGARPLVQGKRAVGHRDFNGAKQVLPGIFTGTLQEEFYCGCDYSGKKVDLASCGYEPRKNAERASRIEWEHVVPAWVIGHQRQCWQKGGRDNCSRNDPVYQVAEGDLNNLVPSIGEVNGDRSNFPYSAWERNPEPIYGQCKTVVDFKLKRAQPREEVRGRVARVYFYMHDRYQLAISKQDKQLMCAWSKTYPVDAWERERDKRIARLQGEGNPYVTAPEKLVAKCS
ncbi:HNH endonuclease family protein [Chitinimonas naiadis]